MAIGFTPRSSPPQVPEHVLWVGRDRREVRAVLRAYSHGVELRLIYKNELLWSRLFPPDDQAAFDAAAAAPCKTGKHSAGAPPRYSG